MAPHTSLSPTQSAQRRAARLAAVQALYEMEISGHHARKAIDSFRERGGTADLDGETIQADGAFFTEIVLGVTGGRQDLDRVIEAAIEKGRKVASLETVLRAILRAGAYEMARRDEIDPPVVISEYLTIAAAFYDTAETGFVNGILDRLATVLRQDDVDLIAPDADHG
ncbi:MAG: transcription antitermination factor NusB [Rhodospirillaceae bacterium]|nr:transcription antitermination factor NusB [Rhodospirillaceae bacterium]MAX62224.1 transcription antitermination factor NusB [Rhodospirillaceae bacterium]MBB56784.1 transcription antitermination factor NusB [Rhodospirillaceae bacterium]